MGNWSFSNEREASDQRYLSQSPLQRREVFEERLMPAKWLTSAICVMR
jgi:hypothetical protein